MSIPLTINGAVFEYPQDFDEAWGVDATGWAQAVTNGMLQMAGGSFPITADINFGANFGLLAKYFETRSAFPATTGTIRLSSADAGIAWRNNAHGGNLILTTNSSDELLYNGNQVLTSAGSGFVSSITGTANQIIASSATGAVTLSTPQSIATTSSPTFFATTLTATATQLVLGTGNQIGISAPTPAASRLYTIPDTSTSTANFIMSEGTQTINGTKTFGTPIAVNSGGTGDASFTAYAVLTGGTTSTAPIQSVATVGSAGQVLTSNGAGALPTFQNATGTGTVNSGTASHLGYYATSSATISDSGIVNTNVFLADGTVSATGALNLGSHKITNITNGSSAQDAVAFTQLTTGAVITTGGVASNTLTGSTANSGGSAGNISQGTISTPDLRTNAITQFIEKSGDSGGNSVSGFTSIDTITITSLGGPIVFSGNVDLELIQSGGNIVWSLGIWKGSSTTALPGGFGTRSVDAQTGGSQDSVIALNASDTPVAGTNTYHIGYKAVSGTSPIVANYNFRAIELRA